MDSKKLVKLVVGVLAVFLFARAAWGLADETLFASQTAVASLAPDSQVKFGIVDVLPILVNLLVAIGGLVISQACNLWAELLKLRYAFSGPPTEQVPATPNPATAIDQQRELVLNLAKAAQSGDAVALRQYANELRTTEAIARDIVTATQQRDHQATKRLLDELAGKSFLDSDPGE